MKPFGLLLIILSATFPAYQLFTLPDVTDQIALFSQYLGLMALVLMAWAQIMATRMPGVELVFGGLDQTYVVHKWAGIAAMVAILLHDTIDAEMRGLGRETVLTEIAETLGEISLYGLLVLVVLSVATFVPYHLWKWTHKAMGALFAAGCFHFFFILKPFAMGDPAGLYTGVFCLAGLLAYGWTLLPARLKPARLYEITGLKETGGALAIELGVKDRGLRASPGQFGSFQFLGSGNNEPHPFSFSRLDDKGNLRVTVKALGDFTSGLGARLSKGQIVRVQGPYGRFRLAGKASQIWIAGGIGITPFLTWAHSLEASAAPVHLFYCIRSRDQAPHLVELEDLAKHKGNLTLHIVNSSESGRLTADQLNATVGGDLSNFKFAFCGPVALRHALQTGLRKFGVSARQFHYEEFEFRTGIGLGRLSAWLLNKARNRI